MEDPNVVQSVPDILGTDLTGFTTSYPVLSAGAYEVEIEEMKVVRGKDLQKGGMNLEFVVSTKYPAKDTEGKELPAGHKITDRFSLTQTKDYTAEMIGRRLKCIRKAVLGEAGETGTFGDPAQYLHAVVTAKVSVEVDKNGVYDPKNKVAFVPRKD